MALTSNGQLLSQFGIGGIASPELPSLGYAGASGALLSDGSLIIASNCLFATPNGYEAMCVYRVTSEGMFDLSFGTGGRLMLQAPGMSQGSVVRSVVVLPNRRVLVAGDCASRYYTGGAKFCAVAIDERGEVDTSFASSGWFLPDVSAYHVDLIRYQLADVVVGPDGHLFLAGSCQSTGSQYYDFCVLAIDQAGKIYTRFGMDGLVTAGSASSFPELMSSAIALRRGRLLLVGYAFGAPAPAGRAVMLHGHQDFFDLDDDNDSNAETDGAIFLRYLLGYRGDALSNGVLGERSARRSASIGDYVESANAAFPNCNKNIVGAPNGPFASVDAVILVRAMLGLTGDAVTSGISFPPGTARTSWGDIRSHLVVHCGMVLSE